MKILIIVAFFCFIANSFAETEPDHCGNCQVVIGKVEQKFHNASSDQALQNFLQVCGKIENLSNACNNINATFFNEIYKHLEANFRPNDFCFTTGECSNNISIVPAIEIVQSLSNGERDSPECELCKELVKHLVAEVTEDDFHELLQNACKQMESFQSDCIRMVDEYHSLIYDFLLDKLNVKAVCSFIGICPGPGLFGGPVLLPAVNPGKVVVKTATKPVPNTPAVQTVASSTTPSTLKTLPPSVLHPALDTLPFFPNYEPMPLLPLFNVRLPSYSYAAPLALPVLPRLPLFIPG